VDPRIVVAGLIVGLLVGTTGAGGGALMTPILILLFGVTPTAAVSSDIVASAIMKPFGGLIHLRRGTVHLGLVGWLSLGSVPAAFAGVFIDHALGKGSGLQQNLEYAMGAALVLAAGAMTLRMISRSQRAEVADDAPVPVKRAVTVAIGVVGGLLVGVTSVGAGSVMIVLLMLVYPRLSMRRLIGTDIVQSMPLVGAAAVGHALFGSLQFGLTAAIAVGSIPGVIAGSLLSSRAPGNVLRPILTVVLFATAVKLFGGSTGTVALAAVVVAAVLGGSALVSRVKPERPGAQPDRELLTTGSGRTDDRSSSSPSRRGDTAA
jgi:uncharacterized protein